MNYLLVPVRGGVKNIARPLSRLLAVFALIFVGGCDNDDASPTGSNFHYVNTWIQENMEAVYLWNDELPKDVNTRQEPETYFSSLLSDEDRFSWIQENYEELLNSLQGINKEAGFEFVLYRDGSGSDVIAQILYVKPSSPASTAGLKRGDVITTINGTRMTTSNYQNLIPALKENPTVKYKPLILSEEQFGPETSISLQTVQYIENPNYLFKIINTGERRIGYYVYNFFASGPDEGTQYDQEMDDIFSIFKSEGITDLILDLRFNSGGSEVCARNLASLIAPGISSSDLFFSKIYNDQLMEQIHSDPDLGEAFLNSLFLEKASNVGAQLSNNRVYILTSSRTASASELIINGLLPYMDVFLIGDVTYGKNVGSISIYEENDPKNTYGMQPIVVKVANRDGASDYSAGFTPNVKDLDNSLYLYPLGDERENLLQQAINHISGEGDPGRKAAPDDRPILGHSLDTKRGSFSLVVENRFK